MIKLPKPRKNTLVFTIRIPVMMKPDMVMALGEEAKRLGVSRSHLIRDAVNLVLCQREIKTASNATWASFCSALFEAKDEDAS